MIGAEDEGRKYLQLSSGLEFPRFFPGPMEGVMTPLFCRVFHELELTDGWLTAYYRVTTNVPKDSRLKNFLSPYMEAGLPVIVQLMGTDGPLMAKVAERMVTLGAAGINLNFACPSRQVIKSGAGGALLCDVSLMRKIIDSIRNSLPEISLSVKIRCGFENWHDIDKIIPALNTGGCIDFFGIHFRTVKELYSHVPDGAGRLKRVIDLAEGIPVIGSGDVFSRNDVDRFLKLGCAGVMPARGVLRDPFLIRKLQHPGSCELSEEEGRRSFFISLQQAAKLDERFRKRAKFLEYAGMMWGTDSKLFLRFKDLNDKQLVGFKF